MNQNTLTIDPAFICKYHRPAKRNLPTLRLTHKMVKHAVLFEVGA